MNQVENVAANAAAMKGTSNGAIKRKQSKSAELEVYLSELKMEVQAVEEHLADLRR